MSLRAVFIGTLLSWVVFLGAVRAADDLIVEGAPTDSGFPVGSQAGFRVTLASATKTDFKQFLVFADVSYMGTTAVSSAQLDLKGVEPAGEGSRATFEGSWLIPSEAPSGIYSVTVRLEDRGARKIFNRKKIRGFGAFKKPIRIARTALDRAFYTEGQAIRAEVVLQNHSSQEIKGLRVEFSNAYYPWISPFPEEGKAEAQNPELAIKVLRDQINIPPLSEVTVPMSPAGRAAFLQGGQAVMLGTGGKVRSSSEPPPEVNSYTVALWNADRTVLYDVQFTTPAVVRGAGRERPKPYDRNFTHTYNSDIDFKKNREFYPRGLLSPAITINLSNTMYRRGEAVVPTVLVKNTSNEVWKGAHVEVTVTKPDGTERGGSPNLVPADDYAPGQTGGGTATALAFTPNDVPGIYTLNFSVVDYQGRARASTTKEVALNDLPASLMVFNAHPDDEASYGGLIRAAVEAGIPIRVVFFTSGDVGACPRYYGKPCGPNEAREFGMLRMEESSDALAHLGVPRENVTFLGLPDGGSGSIWFQHVNSARPFRSVSLGTDHAPYEDIYRPNLTYSRDAVIEATKQLIAEFHPEMIVTTHPDERHVDHRTANWFVVKACQELLREQRIDGKTEILADVSYGGGGFKPAPYRYETYTVHMSGEAAALTQEMDWLYQSQHGNQAEGDRKTYGELPRLEEHVRILDWQKFAGWNE